MKNSKVTIKFESIEAANAFAETLEVDYIVTTNQGVPCLIVEAVELEDGQELTIVNANKNNRNMTISSIYAYAQRNDWSNDKLNKILSSNQRPHTLDGSGSTISDTVEVIERTSLSQGDIITIDNMVYQIINSDYVALRAL